MTRLLHPHRLSAYACSSQGVVFSTISSSSLAYVVKILDPNSEELAIYQRLLCEIRQPNNHTLPSEIALDYHPLLIMPFVGALDYFRQGDLSPRALVDAIFQLVEVCRAFSSPPCFAAEIPQGVEFLHSQHIAHMVRHPAQCAGCMGVLTENYPGYM